MIDIVTVFISILIEATPFLLLGVFIASLVQQKRLFEVALKRLPRNRFVRRLCISFFGVALPVCECGNVPLARSLRRKGLTTAEATTFLLAAPILNPITFITTREAFRSVPWMLPARMLGGLLVALIVGELIGRLKSSALTEEFEKSCHAHAVKSAKKQHFSLKFAEEFWPMLKLLIVGAFIAACTQYLLSQSFLADYAQNYFTGVLIMLALGFIISICSSVDAFFALAYAGTVRYGALLTFLIAGPMVDIKLLAMMKTTYTKKALAVLTASVAVLASVIGLGMSYVG